MTAENSPAKKDSPEKASIEENNEFRRQIFLMYNTLVGTVHSVTDVNETVSSRLQRIESLENEQSVRRQTVAVLEEKLKMVEDTAQFMGIKIPEKAEEGVAYSDFVQKALGLKEKYKKEASRLSFIQQVVSEKAFWEIMQVIVSDQTDTLTQMANVWKGNHEDLFGLANKTKDTHNAETKEELFRIQAIHSSIFVILKERDRPIGKTDLANELAEMGHSKTLTIACLEMLLHDNPHPNLEAGWCSNAARVTSTDKNIHGAGVVYKHISHAIPEDVCFYNGMDRERVYKMIQQEILSIVNNLPAGEKITRKEVLLALNKKVPQPIPYQTVVNHLNYLYFQNLIKMTRNRPFRGFVFSPVSDTDKPYPSL